MEAENVGHISHHCEKDFGICKPKEIGFILVWDLRQDTVDNGETHGCRSLKWLVTHYTPMVRKQRHKWWFSYYFLFASFLFIQVQTPTHGAVSHSFRVGLPSKLQLSGNNLLGTPRSVSPR